MTYGCHLVTQKIKIVLATDKCVSYSMGATRKRWENKEDAVERERERKCGLLFILSQYSWKIGMVQRIRKIHISISLAADCADFFFFFDRIRVKANKICNGFVVFLIVCNFSWIQSVRWGKDDGDARGEILASNFNNLIKRQSMTPYVRKTIAPQNAECLDFYPFSWNLCCLRTQ